MNRKKVCNKHHKYQYRNRENNAVYKCFRCNILAPVQQVAVTVQLVRNPPEKPTKKKKPKTKVTAENTQIARESVARWI